METTMWTWLLVVLVILAAAMGTDTRLPAATIAPTTAPAHSAAPRGNRIANPSFETRSGPRQPYPAEPWGYESLDGVARSPFAHWGYSGFWDGGDYDIKLGQGHTGKLCARLVCRKRGRGGICTEEIRAAVGQRLAFRGFFRAMAARGTCWVNFEGDPGDGWARLNLPDRPDYDWTEVAGEVTVPAPRGRRPPAADGTVGIHVFIYTTAYGELWVDDVTLVPVGEPASRPASPSR